MKNYSYYESIEISANNDWIRGLKRKTCRKCGQRLLELKGKFYEEANYSEFEYLSPPTKSERRRFLLLNTGLLDGYIIKDMVDYTGRGYKAEGFPNHKCSFYEV